MASSPARTQGEMAEQLGLSQPEISNALRRLKASQLVLQDAREPNIPNLLEFCEHGVRYAFAVQAGGPKRGLPTGSLASPLKEKLSGDEGALVWASPDGPARAPSLEPLHPCVLHAAQRDAKLYRMLSLLDGIRVGRNRMRKVAAELLAQEFAARGPMP